MATVEGRVLIRKSHPVQSHGKKRTQRGGVGCGVCKGTESAADSAKYAEQRKGAMCAPTVLSSQLPSDPKICSKSYKFSDKDKPVYTKKLDPAVTPPKVESRWFWPVCINLEVTFPSYFRVLSGCGCGRALLTERSPWLAVFCEEDCFNSPGWVGFHYSGVLKQDWVF